MENIMKISKEATEQELRALKVEWPNTQKELLETISNLVDRNHDYGTCVYAMSIAAISAFYYVAHKLGTTGFQASCADLDIIRRSRHMEGPFMIVDGNKMLYPQYNLVEKLEEAIKAWKPWAKEQAEKLLKESGGHAHPNVIAHWKKLASWESE